jgi:large subunit ribosomal protein L19
MALDWMKAIHGEGASKLPSFRPGDRIRVWYRISEQGKERLGQFEGDVTRARGAGPSRTFTVRRVTYGEGVERVFPFDSKSIARVEVLQPGAPGRGAAYRSCSSGRWTRRIPPCGRSPRPRSRNALIARRATPDSGASPALTRPAAARGAGRVLTQR